VLEARSNPVFVDLSVKASEAIEVASGTARVQQIATLLHERRRQIEMEVEELERAAVPLREAAAEAAVEFDRINGMCERLEAARSPVPDFEPDIKVGPNYLRVRRELEAERFELAKLDLPALLSHAATRRNETARRLSPCEGRLQDLRRTLLSLSHRELDAQETDLLPLILPSIRWPEAARLASKEPALALAITNRIAAADVVVVIAEMWSQYKPWVEFETLVGTQMGRPVIAVLPPGQTHAPREVAILTHQVSEWDPERVADAIVNASKRQRDNAPQDG
jgi:hypothetical protein